MNTSTYDSDSQDPRRIEREIDQKRDHIGDLVSALESKLSPGELFERVLDAGKGNGGEFARNLGGIVKANPVPALLVSAGLVWLYASRNEQPMPHAGGRPAGLYGSSDYGRAAYADTGYGSSAQGSGQAAHDAQGLLEQAVQLGQGAREKWHDATARVGEGMHGAKDSLQHGAQRARGGFEHMLQDNPMAVGAIAIAVGALLGAVLPTTEQENRLMGELGDKVTGKAKSVASSVYEKGAETAKELGNQAKSAANSVSTAGTDDSTSSDGVSSPDTRQG